MTQQILPKEIEKLKKFVFDNFKKAGLDFETFDFHSEIDNEISFYENLEKLKEKLKIIGCFKEETITKEKYNSLVEQEIKKAEVQADLEFEKAIEKISKSPTTNIIEDFYFIPKSLSKMVAMGNSRGFILYGEAGLGKSYCVLKAFKECDKKFVYISGHITSLELYMLLFENRKENIILDDTNILNSEINLNMIKSALNDNSRLVSYKTTSSKLKVPNKFIFDGTITILLNEKPSENKNLSAVETRVLNYELKMNYFDKMKVIAELSKNDYKDLTAEERKEIFEWLKQNTTKATKNFSLRSLFMVYELFRYSKQDWKKISRGMFVYDKEIELIIQDVGWKEWCEVTGKSKKTYYRKRKDLLEH